jgi:hypothetical protein
MEARQRCGMEEATLPFSQQTLQIPAARQRVPESDATVWDRRNTVTHHFTRTVVRHEFLVYIDLSRTCYHKKRRVVFKTLPLRACPAYVSKPLQGYGTAAGIWPVAGARSQGDISITDEILNNAC